MQHNLECVNDLSLPCFEFHPPAFSKFPSYTLTLMMFVCWLGRYFVQRELLGCVHTEIWIGFCENHYHSPTTLNSMHTIYHLLSFDSSTSYDSELTLNSNQNPTGSIASVRSKGHGHMYVCMFHILNNKREWNVGFSFAIFCSQLRKFLR